MGAAKTPALPLGSLSCLLPTQFVLSLSENSRNSRSIPALCPAPGEYGFGEGGRHIPIPKCSFLLQAQPLLCRLGVDPLLPPGCCRALAPSLLSRDVVGAPGGDRPPRGWCPGDADGSEGPAWLCCSSCPAWGAGKQLIPPGECGRHRGRISCARNVPGVMCRAGGCTGGSSGVWGQWGPGGSSLGESRGLCPAGSTGATPGR